MKFSYTTSGQAALEEFHAAQQRHLEKLISEQKYVLGDEFVEVTAADIHKARSSFKVLYKFRPRALQIHELVLISGPIFLTFMVGIALSMDSKIFAAIKESEAFVAVILSLFTMGACFCFISYQFVASSRRRMALLDRSRLIDGPIQNRDLKIGFDKIGHTTIRGLGSLDEPRTGGKSTLEEIRKQIAMLVEEVDALAQGGTLEQKSNKGPESS